MRLKPKNHETHKSLISAGLAVEKQWLNQNAPLFGEPSTPEYQARAKAFSVQALTGEADELRSFW